MFNSLLNISTLSHDDALPQVAKIFSRTCFNIIYNRLHSQKFKGIGFVYVVGHILRNQLDAIHSFSTANAHR